MQGLIDLVNDDLGTMAMVNYPYATNFTADIPAWPLMEACNRAITPPASQNDDSDDHTTTSVFNTTHIEAIQRAFNLYNNYTGKQECLDLGGPSN